MTNVVVMARHCDFDRDAAVDSAVDTFWGGSYNATSTEALCETMGVSRSSLYNTFGSKARLYQESLSRYAEQKDAERRTYLEMSGTGRERLRRLLSDVLGQQRAFPDRRCCLIVNAVVEVGSADERVAEMARANLSEFRRLLADLIIAGQCDGSIRADRSAEDCAQLVHATLNGLQVGARVDTDPDAPLRAVDTLLRLL